MSGIIPKFESDELARLMGLPKSKDAYERIREESAKLVGKIKFEDGSETSLPKLPPIDPRQY